MLYTTCMKSVDMVDWRLSTSDFIGIFVLVHALVDGVNFLTLNFDLLLLFFFSRRMPYSK